MTTKLNSAAATYASSLIGAGKVNRTAPWSFDASDGNALLGSDGDDWDAYGRAHLGVDPSASDKTKDRYKYPFAKDGVLFRSGLVAIRQRAGQQSDTSVFDAAGTLLDRIDGNKSEVPGQIEHKGVGGVEFKFVSGSDAGEFEGYGSVFGNQDWHGDVIQPGAFAESLARHKAQGTMPALHAEHDWAYGGDSLPAGVWTDMAEDDKGLRVKGKISALDTDYGKRLHGLMKDGAMKGLSIAFTVPPGGSERPKAKDAPDRILKRIDLKAVDVVKWPSNDRATVEQVKAMMRNVDADKAIQACVAAMTVHRATMAGGDSPSADERQRLFGHLQDIHESLTGERMPKGMKAKPATIRECEEALREMGYTHAEARVFAERGFKALAPRDEAAGQASEPTAKNVLAEMAGALSKLKI